jgi:intracellular sulfur oxidation DsrE/DsrF family protein
MKRVLPLLAALTVSSAAQEYRAVFDCSSSDPRYILSRMALTERTKTMIEARGDTALFAVTIHGGCIVAASKEYDLLVPEEEAVYIKKAQETLARLAKDKVDVVACAIALEGFGIDREDVVPFMRISENSYIDTIGYQNRGYALMPLK